LELVMSRRSHFARPTTEERLRIRERLDTAILDEQGQHDEAWTTELEAVPTSGSESRTRTGLLTAVAAAVIFAIVPWLLRPEPPAADTPPPIPQAPTPTAPVEPDQRAFEWSHTELPVRVNSLVVHEGRFFAIGGGLVLASNDGSNWTEIGRLPSGASVSQLVSHGPRLVARGAEITEDSDGAPLPIPSVWASEDEGVTWVRADIEGHISDIASTPSGLVAAGSIDLGQDGDRVRWQAAVWLSDDGRAWTLAWSSNDPEGTSSNADATIWDESGITILGRHGPDRYYGDGLGNPDPVWERVAWIGSTASELGGPTPVGLPGNMEAQTRIPGGHIALVYGFDRSVKESSAVWGSDNGVHWTPIEVDPENWSYNTVAADGHAIVIAGDTLGASDSPEPRVWLSTDGITWESLDISALPEELRLGSVALHDGLLVVAGHHDPTPTGYLFTGRLIP
jgi:hypothetical protein